MYRGLSALALACVLAAPAGESVQPGTPAEIAARQETFSALVAAPDTTGLDVASVDAITLVNTFGTLLD
jgi:hypothetical protein